MFPQKVPRISKADTNLATTEANAEPARHIGWFDATNLVVGGIIGSGIFLVPGEIARNLPNPRLILGVWIVTGLLSFIGALAYAELGAMLPASGGQYVYLREAYGRLIAFLFGWTSFLVIQTGTIATLAVGFAIYLGYFIPIAAAAQKMVGLALIVALTALNIYGVHEAIWFQTLCTILRVAGIALLIVAALLAPAYISAPHAASVHTITFATLRSGLGPALAACFWTYEGWYLLGFVAGEVKRPRRTIPSSLAVGMAIVMFLYIAANVAYLRILPIDRMAATERVASVVADTTMGRAGGVLVGLTILISTAGCLNSGILAAPRLYFAQARDGLFFQAAGRLHPRWGTPSASLLIQGAWSAVLALSGSYEILYSYVIFASWLFYGLAVFGVIILRRSHPEWERPYRMWAYPVAPVLFAAFAFSFLVSTFLGDPRPSLIGVAIVAAGIPVYFIWRRAAVVETQVET